MPEDFAAAVVERLAPPAVPQACENGKTGAKPKNKTREKTSVFPGSSFVFANVRDGLVLRQGFEPTPENTGKSRDSESYGPTDGPKPQPADVAALAAVLATLPPDRLAAVLAAVVQPQASR